MSHCWYKVYISYMSSIDYGSYYYKNDLDKISLLLKKYFSLTSPTLSNPSYVIVDRIRPLATTDFILFLLKHIIAGRVGGCARSNRGWSDPAVDDGYYHICLYRQIWLHGQI